MIDDYNWSRKYLNEQFNLLTKISDDLASLKIQPDKWSRKEILGHLIDSANVNFNRFINAVSKNDLIFETYPQDEWVKLQCYNNRNWNELVDLWKSLNLHIIELVNNISQNIRTNETNQHNFNEICWNVIPKVKQSSLNYLINDYIGHLEHHINQIHNY